MRYPIVRPKPDAPDSILSQFKRIAPGSVAVAAPQGRGVLVHYEGGIYNRSKTVVPYGDVSGCEFRPASRNEQIEYAKIAAGRLHAHYPTTSFFHLSGEVMESLEQIGYVDAETWEVKFYE